MMMTNTLGCAVCRAGIYTGGEPAFIAITSPVDLLFRCNHCHTWWIGDGHAAWPVSEEDTRDRFPMEVPE